MDINHAALNLLHEKSEEQFIVNYRSSYGVERHYGPDSAAGIIAYLYASDEIINIERVS